MVIEKRGAEMGLAQLHRNPAAASVEGGQHVSSPAAGTQTAVVISPRTFAVMRQIYDGFEVARRDLELSRTSKELLGPRQTGLHKCGSLIYCVMR
jgi:RecG-like helicase